MSDKILKAGVLPGQKVLKQDVFEAGQEAAQVLVEASRKAEALLEDARQQAEAERQKAHEEGYNEGLKQWNNAVAEAIAARDRYLRDSEPEVIQLAVRIAEKILGIRIKKEPSSIVAIVRETLRGIRQERNLTISVHPDHVDIVRDRIKELEEQAGEDCRIRIKGSSTITPGGCLVESELGTIDARLETQLKCLEDILMREAKR